MRLFFWKPNRFELKKIEFNDRKHYAYTGYKAVPPLKHKRCMAKMQTFIGKQKPTDHSLCPALQFLIDMFGTYENVHDKRGAITEQFFFIHKLLDKFPNLSQNRAVELLNARSEEICAVCRDGYDASSCDGCKSSCASCNQVSSISERTLDAVNTAKTEFSH